MYSLNITITDLALTSTCGLVTIGTEAFQYITVAGATDRVTPPGGRAGLLDGPFTVLPRTVLGAFTHVSM